jgi:hypothetical protein
MGRLGKMEILVFLATLDLGIAATEEPERVGEVLMIWGSAKDRASVNRDKFDAAVIVGIPPSTQKGNVY